MNKETRAPKVGKTNGSIVENIYGIIDSKIQYLDYQTRELFRPHIGENTPTDSVSNQKNGPQDLKTKEAWFLAFEKYSRQKKTLLLLRNYLNKENALMVLSLLAEDQLYQFSQKDLEYKLDVPRRHQAA
ncbi:MAG: hypothetical protein AAGJ18_13680 [Bacteroidota bacterium]